MSIENEADKRKKIFNSDLLFVGGILTIYSACCILFIVGISLLAKQSTEIANANATATEVSAVTQQANATTTAIVRSTEQANFGFIERFDSRKYQWRVGHEDDAYWNEETKIANGVYTWDIKEAKDTFISWTNFPYNNNMGNFHAYVDVKLLSEGSGNICGGFLFRVVETDLDKGGYYFTLCNDSSVPILYYKRVDGWQRITTQHYYKPTDEWNRLEIIARGTHFQFLINGEQIYEMEDDRIDHGGLALVVDIQKEEPAKVIFDNFGLQR